MHGVLLSSWQKERWDLGSGSGRTLGGVSGSVLGYDSYDMIDGGTYLSGSGKRDASRWIVYAWVLKVVPPGMKYPQSVLPPGGVTRGRLEGAAPYNLRVSSITALRRGNFSRSASVISGLKPRTSSSSIIRSWGLFKTAQIRYVNVIAVVSDPATIRFPASRLTSMLVRFVSSFSDSARMVEKTLKLLLLEPFALAIA